MLSKPNSTLARLKMGRLATGAAAKMQNTRVGAYCTAVICKKGHVSIVCFHRLWARQQEFVNPTLLIDVCIPLDKEV